MSSPPELPPVIAEPLRKAQCPGQAQPAIYIVYIVPVASTAAKRGDGTSSLLHTLLALSIARLYVAQASDVHAVLQLLCSAAAMQYLRLQVCKLQLRLCPHRWYCYFYLVLY
jgi:hypothetical protein